MSSIGMTAIQAAIMPSANGLVRSLTGTSLTNQMSKAGLYSGKSWTTGFQRAVSGLKMGALIAGAAATIAPGMVIKGGLDRALNIEDARAKLDGLKYSAQDVNSITEDIRASVLGTRFALDQAVGAGVSALAAGIPKGQGLTDYLTLIGDTATIAGTDLKEVGYIFNKIQSNVYAYSRELAMLADRGIPIWSWLSEYYGKSVYEVRKLVADSKVTAEDMQAAIRNNIGGAALKSANTTRGALANMRAAFSRLGEVILKDTLPITREFYLANIRFADAIAKRVTPTMEKFWSSAKPAGVTWMKDLAATLEKLARGGYNLGQSPLARALKDMKATVMGFAGVAPAMEAVGSIFLNEAGKFKTFGEGMDTIWFALLPLMDAIQKLYGIMAPTAKLQFGQFFEALAADALVLRDNMQALWPQMQEFGTVLLGSIGAVLKSIIPLIIAAMPVITTLATALLTAFIRVGTAVAPVLAGLLVSIVDLVTKGFNLLAPHMPALLSFFENWSPIAAVINGVTAALSGNKDGLSGLALFVANITDVFMKMMGGLEGAGGGISGFFKTIGDVFNTVGTIVTQVVTAIGPHLSQLAEMFSTVFSQIATDNGPIMVQIWESLKNLFAQLGPSLVTMMGAWGELGGSVLQSLMIIIVKALPPLLSLLPPIIDLIAKLLPMFMDMVSAILPKISEALPFLIESAMEFVKVLIEGLPQIIEDISSIFTPEVMDAVVFFTGLWAENLQNAMYLLGVLFKIAAVLFKITGFGGMNIGKNISDGISDFLYGKRDPEEATSFMAGVGNVTDSERAARESSEGPALGYFQSSWKPKKLWTGGNIMGSREGTGVIVGDRNKAETVTDLGQTNDFISSTLKLVRQVGSTNGQPSIYSPSFHYEIVNQTDLSGETIVRKIDEYNSNVSVYGGYNYNG